MNTRWFYFVAYFCLGNTLVSSSSFADLDNINENENLVSPKSDETKPTKNFEMNPDLGRKSDLSKIKPAENPLRESAKEDSEAILEPSPKTVPPTRKNGVSEERPDYKNEPVEWSAKSFKGSRENKEVELIGNVKVKQVDVVLTADKATLFFKKDETVDQIVATGSVKMVKSASSTSSEVIARGREAVFYNDEQKISLSGRASLIRNGDVVRGKQITYELKTGLITVDNVEGVMKKQDVPLSKSKKN